MRREVVAAVIERDGLFFVAQRKAGIYAGKWEFPGGKVETGESARSALVREIKEELGVEILPRELLAEVEFSVNDGQYLLLAYLAEHLEGEYQPVDHCAVDWVAPPLLASLDMPPADIPVADLLSAADFQEKIPAFFVID